MIHRLVVFSGTIASGKSSVAKRLADRFGVPRLSTREVIKLLRPTTGDDRKKLQAAGAELDRETDGRWVADAFGRWASENNATGTVILDAVRQPNQMRHLRNEYSRALIQVHVDAESDERRRRYDARGIAGDEYSFDEVCRDPIEAAVPSLADDADVCLDSTFVPVEDLVSRVAGVARLYGTPNEQLVDVVVGGQWGSEGKGQIAAYLAPDYEVLVRVGGPNAGHSVYAEPTPLKFHHLPSGWGRNTNALLVLGPGAVIFVEDLLKEVMEHEVPETQLRIDPQAMVINRADHDAELLLQKAIGSTRRGVGSATARKVMRVEGSIEKWSAVSLAKSHPDLKSYIRPTMDILEESYRHRRRILLEGTQGTLLSLHHGTFPYVTSRDTTVPGCLAEAGIPSTRVRRIVMTCRTYPIRVRSPDDSTSGPMEREITWADISKRSGIPVEEIEKAEHTTTTHKLRRVSEFGWEGVRRAAVLNGPTDIALTFADYLGVANRKARRFDQLTPETRQFVNAVEQLTGVPVSMIAKDFSVSPIIDRRQW